LNHRHKEVDMKTIGATIVLASVLSATSVFAANNPAPLPKCKDGTTAIKAGKGACVHHGGVNVTLTDAKSNGSTPQPIPKPQP
jgi:hypothetical protein